MLASDFFVSLVSGAHDDETTGVLGDLGGHNIASPNWHSEMRHQYHVWHDRLESLDYVGFEHYRRLFFLNPLNVARLRRFNPWLLDVARQLISDETCVGAVLDETLFNAYLDLREICEGEMRSFTDALMENSDIVTHRVQPLRLDEQFKLNHPAEHWDIFTATVRETRFYARSHDMIDFGLRTSFFCNMYVVRTELFAEYMEFWWSVMETLSQRIPLRERYLGYFSERLVNLFIHGKRLADPRLRVRSLPFAAHTGGA